MNQLGWMIINSQCENALIDLPFHDILNTWIEEYHSLFIQVNTIMQGNQINKIQSASTSFIYSFYQTYLSANLSKLRS